MALNRNDNAALFWNDVLLEALLRDSKKPLNQQEQGGPTRASRAAAIVHASLHNAVNGCQQKNKFYQEPSTGQPPPPGSPPSGAEMEAAGAGAAHHALAKLFPAQAQDFAKARATFQALPINGANHAASFGYGKGIADALLQARSNDGSATADAYTPPAPAPGVWVPDPVLAPPGPPLTPRWGDVRPFLLRPQEVTKLLPSPFSPLDSGDYTLQFASVRDKGVSTSQVNPPQGRNSDEEQTALFFSYDDMLGTPIRLYNQHVFEILAQAQPAAVPSLHAHARVFALVNLAMADAGIVCWRAKFGPPPMDVHHGGYHIWRPVQGIRAADTDGNAGTSKVPGWLPLGRPRATDAAGAPAPNTTPNFPAYVSGHSSFGSACYGTLRKFYDQDMMPTIAFTLSSDELPNIRRSYAPTQGPAGGSVDSLAQVIEENGLSRIYLGVHWRRDHTRGRPLGQGVADYAWNRKLLASIT